MTKNELLEPRKIPSQERSRKTMAAIYEAAAQVFTSVGYVEATTEQIAEKAGVSIGSLYNYFSGKEAILNGLWEKYVDEITVIIKKIDDDIRKEGFVDKTIIPLLLHVVLDLISYKRARNRLFISQIGLPETIIQKRSELIAYIESTIEAIFRDFANVRIADPRIGVHIIVTTVQAVMHDYILNASDKIKAENFIAELADMMGRYVFADDDPNRESHENLP
ncbi:MAG TPA: TetR/AcrR family transcriptional regulator [Smithella sp.]|nr:TetR/AcrR family transcriptional regulator [Smithella sp.]